MNLKIEHMPRKNEYYLRDTDEFGIIGTIEQHKHEWVWVQEPPPWASEPNSPMTLAELEFLVDHLRSLEKYRRAQEMSDQQDRI